MFSGRSAGLRLLPVSVQDVRQRPAEGLLPLRRLQGDARTDAGTAGHGGRRHHRSLDLTLWVQFIPLIICKKCKTTGLVVCLLHL